MTEGGDIMFVPILAHERGTEPPACAENHDFHFVSVSAVRRQDGRTIKIN